jgi:hypothetical protein
MAQKFKLKKENKKMANKVTIVGNAFVLTSSIKLETIKKLEKYNSDALVVCTRKEDEIVEVFRVMSGKKGSICNAGVVFATANKDGFATVTDTIPENVKDKKQWVKDHYANVLFMLKGLESTIDDMEADIDKAFAELDEMIEEA